MVSLFFPLGQVPNLFSALPTPFLTDCPPEKKRDDEEGAKKPPFFWEMPLYRTFRKLSCCSPNRQSPIPHFRSFHFCGICGKGPTILFPDLSEKTDRFRPQRVEEKTRVQIRGNNYLITIPAAAYSFRKNKARKLKHKKNDDKVFPSFPPHPLADFKGEPPRPPVPQVEKCVESIPPFLFELPLPSL